MFKYFQKFIHFTKNIFIKSKISLYKIYSKIFHKKIKYDVILDDFNVSHLNKLTLKIAKKNNVANTLEFNNLIDNIFSNYKDFLNTNFNVKPAFRDKGLVFEVLNVMHSLPLSAVIPISSIFFEISKNKNLLSVISGTSINIIVEIWFYDEVANILSKKTIYSDNFEIIYFYEILPVIRNQIIAAILTTFQNYEINNVVMLSITFI